MLSPPQEVPAGARTARSTLPFFTLALGITWLLQAPALLAKYGLIPGSVDSYLLPATLGGFGPLLAALLAARWERNPAGLRAAFRPLRPEGVGAGWYVLALGLCPAIHLAGSAVYRAAGGEGAGPWLYLPENAPQIAALLIIPLAEEPGWRGFALPRLEERYGPLQASLVLGVAWAAWHWMMFLLAGGTPTLALFALALANIACGSVVFGWLYHRTRGSLLIAIVAHAGVHLNNPFRALPANATPFAIYTLAIAATAAVLVLADRGAWRGTPRARLGRAASPSPTHVL